MEHQFLIAVPTSDDEVYNSVGCVKMLVKAMQDHGFSRELIGVGLMICAEDLGLIDLSNQIDGMETRQ